MNEIKTDLFPSNLRAAKDRDKKNQKSDDWSVSSMTPAEPLPEPESSKKDGGS